MTKAQKTLTIILLVSISFIYFLSSNYINCSNDGSHFALVSSLVNKKSTIINEYVNYTAKYDYAEKNGNYYSDRLPGNAFLLIPFFKFGNFLENFTSFQRPNYHTIQEVTVIFLPNLCCVLTLFLMLKLALHFGFSFFKSILLIIIFAFSTLIWQESTHIFSHAPSLFFVWLAFYILIKITNVYSTHFYVFVASLSFACIIELQNVLLFLPAMVYLWFTCKIEKDFNKKNIILILFSAIIFTSILSLLITYNYISFHDITLKSNKYNPHFPEEGSFLTSLSGNFRNGLDILFTNFKNKKLYSNLALGTRNDIPGLLVTSPILIASLTGFVFFYKKHKNETILFALIIIINVLIAAFHKTVLVRHIFTITPFLFFPLCFCVQYILKLKQLVLKYSLIGILCCLILISSFRVYYVTNTYFSRDISEIFPFYKESWIYISFLFIIIIFTSLIFLCNALFKFIIIRKYL